MNPIKRIAGNTIWIFSADIFNKIVLIIISIYLARYLGPEQLGIYSFASSYGLFFTLIADLGLNTLIIRDIAKNKKNCERILNNTLGIKIITSTIAYILLILISDYLTDYSGINKLIIYLLGAYLLLSNIGISIRNVFIAYEFMKYDALITILERTIILIAGLYILVCGKGLVYLAIIFIISALISLSYSTIIVYKNFAHIKIAFDLRFQKELIKSSYSFALMGLFGLINMKIAIMMLAILKNNADIGYYNSAYQIVEGFTFIPMLLMTAIFPTLSLQRKIEENKRYIIISLMALFSIVIPLIAVLIYYSETIILLIYGQMYLVTTTTFNILMVCLLFIFLNKPLCYALFARNKQKIVLIIQIAASILNVGLNMYFIRQYSYLGAAITALICEGFIFASLAIVTRRLNYI